jgi:leader peptidase (prepilin peptidase)/N-methyltransferase
MRPDVTPLDVGTGGDVFVLVAASVVGLIIGSFLNVVIHRVPAGESVVTPRSACPRCGTPIAERDNIPVLSWLLLRGRARCCGEPISARYPLVEAFTGLTFAAVTAWAGLSWLLPALLFLAAISIALTLIDLAVKRLPDAITFPSYPIAAALLILPAITAGEPGRIVRALIGGLVLYLAYFALMMVYPAGMGFGDVKLAGILGMYLAWFGWGELVFGFFAAFFIGGPVGITLMVAGRAGRKTQIPFGPYMLVGTWISLIWGGQVADWYLGRIGA